MAVPPGAPGSRRTGPFSGPSAWGVRGQPSSNAVDLPTVTPPGSATTVQRDRTTSPLRRRADPFGPSSPSGANISNVNRPSPSNGNGERNADTQESLDVLDSYFSHNANAIPAPSEGDLNKIGLIRELFYRARTYKRPLISRWTRNYNMLHNRTWGNRAPWMPNPELPEMWPIVAAMTGWMTDSKPEFQITPSAAPFSPYRNYYDQLALDLGVVLHSNWVTLEYDSQVEQVIWDANVYGTGFFKTVWDNTLDGGMGNATIKRADPYTIYPDPDATDMDSLNYIMEVRTVSIQELDRRFPGSADLVRAGWVDDVDRAPSTLTDYTSQTPKANPAAIAPATTPRYGLPGQSDRLRGVDVTDHGITVIEAWLREHRVDADGRTIDSWRCVVTAGNVILLDEAAIDLWEHGQHPFDRFVLVDTGEFWGQSLVELLTPLQLSINRLLAAMEHNIWLLGNPVFKEDTRSGIQRTKITNKPGQRISINAGGTAEWMVPPPMHPQLSSDLIKFYKGEMENISGLSAITRGFMPTGRNASSVMDSVQESAFVRVRLALRNLERALKRCGDKLASLICEYFDTPRIVALTGPGGEKSALVMKSMHFYLPTDAGRVPMKFQLLIEAGSSLPTSRQARAQEADALFAMGALDNEAVLDAHQWPNRSIITSRVRELQAQQGTLGLPPGARQRSGRKS